MALSARNLSTCALALVAAALVCVVGTANGRIIEVEWTPDGVREFNDVRNPLKTQLGDQLVLRCGENVSNLFIQTERIQFDGCNANLGSGMFNFNGFCLPGDVLILTLTKNSRELGNAINFANNTLYYLTSYYNGLLRDAGNSSINSGGQCLSGLRMVIAIGEVVVPPPTVTPILTIPATQAPSGVSGVVDQGDGNNNLRMLYIIVPVAAGSVIVIVLAIIFTIFLIKVCYNKSKMIHHNDPLSHHQITCVIDPPIPDKGFYSLVPSEDQNSPQHQQQNLDVVTSRNSVAQPNFYVDSLRLSPRPSSRYNDRNSTSQPRSEATVNQQSTSDTYAEPSAIKTTTYTSHVLPVATPPVPPVRPARRTAPLPPDYENVAEDDLSHYAEMMSADLRRTLHL